MLKYLTFSVKIQLNVHDLNNEAVVGNVADIRIMEFIDEKGERKEAPAVSGRMLKHWHCEGMKHLIVNGQFNSVPLCAGCKAGEPIRPGHIINGNLAQVAIPENDAIKNCAICDIHGFLIAREAEGEQERGTSSRRISRLKTTKKEEEAKKKERGTSSRRISRAMFSWLMPVLGIETTSKQVIHNRVSADPSVMMPFNKSYASGFYGFVSALDIERIGLVELNLGENNPYAISNEKRNIRIKVAIEAYRLLLSGQMGASLSHSIPHSNPIELIVCLSESSPLPFPVSPIYSDYIQKTRGLMPENTSILYWGKSSPEGFLKKNTINEIFEEILSKIG